MTKKYADRENEFLQYNTIFIYKKSAFKVETGKVNKNSPVIIEVVTVTE